MPTAVIQSMSPKLSILATSRPEIYIPTSSPNLLSDWLSLDPSLLQNLGNLQAQL